MISKVFLYLAAFGLVGACTQDDEGVEIFAGETDGDHDDDKDDDDDDDDCEETLEEQLARARAATERYLDVDQAIADGFIPGAACVSHPELGAMGYHFVNPDRLMDPLSIEEPEALLYIKDTHDGPWRLVGLEYLSVVLVDGRPYFGCGVEDNSCPPEGELEVPTLFTGVTIDGPMAGHEEGMPWHFDQHVWLYEENPSGMFAPFNPNVICLEGCD